MVTLDVLVPYAAEPRQFEMGQRAAELIIKLINNPSLQSNEKVIIDADIIYRESTEEF